MVVHSLLVLAAGRSFFAREEIVTDKESEPFAKRIVLKGMGVGTLHLRNTWGSPHHFHNSIFISPTLRSGLFLSSTIASFKLLTYICA